MPAASSSPTAAANTKTENDVKLQQLCIGASSLIAEAPPRSAAVAERELRNAHAAKVERQARLVALAVRELVEIHARMDREARAIAGNDYEVRHTISFERHCSMDEPRENLSEVLIPGIVNVASMVQDMAEDAQDVTDEDQPLALPSE
jgi:hypothetical protein